VDNDSYRGEEDPHGKMIGNPEHLQMFRQRDERGKLLKDEWESIINSSTTRHGTGDSTYFRVTVTEYFGGRGHDFNVMDPEADLKGGMLVIATSLPDTREWIQWKGRTGRQDKRGQYLVVVSEEDDAFQRNGEEPREAEARKRALLHSFKAERDPLKKIDLMLEAKDKSIKDQLDTYEPKQAKGVWLNDLCQQYYQEYRRKPEEEWPHPSHTTDIELRDTLSAPFENGDAIKKHAKEKFKIDLQGPPLEWRFPGTKDFPGEGPRGPVSAMFVIDVSFSMDEVENYDQIHLSDQDQRDQREMVRRLDRAGAELGALTFSLMWYSSADLDLYVTSPSGETICYTHRDSGCGGKLDIDMNYGSNHSPEPVENCFWQSPPSGTYTFWARSYSGVPEQFVIRVKQKGEVKLHRMTVPPGSDSSKTSTSYPSLAGQSATTRLTTCIECIKDIAKGTLEADDNIGLISFADDVRIDLDLTRRGNPGDPSYTEIVGKVEGLRTRGRTAFYNAVKTACAKIKGRTEDRWVIALTDGADTNSAVGAVPEAERILKETPGLNLALITLGGEVDQEKINKLKAAAEAGGNNGMHVQADDLHAVRAAFENIANEMITPMVGAMG